MALSNPEISVLVTHHLNQNDAYLDACLKSLMRTENVPIEIICVSDAQRPPAVPRDPRIQLIWDGKHVGVGDKWKCALALADPRAPYFASISDDVMVSRWTLGGMSWVLKHSGIGNSLVGPRSNCDQTTRYLADSGYPVKCTLEELDKGKYNGRSREDVIEWSSKELILLPQEWVGFYCVMMPKTVIAQVGELDSKLEVRHNDVDYCFRARKLGIPSLIHLGTFCLHFGDRTIPTVSGPERYAAADQAMKEKYACSSR